MPHHHWIDSFLSVGSVSKMEDPKLGTESSVLPSNGCSKVNIENIKEGPYQAADRQEMTAQRYAKSVLIPVD